MPSLRSLELSSCQLSSAGLAPLATTLAHLEALQITDCPNMHSTCRAQLPDEVARLAALQTLYVDFVLHVRDVQVGWRPTWAAALHVKGGSITAQSCAI
jgi:hypothetical protein